MRICLSVALLLCLSDAFGKDGDIDASFGNGGRTTVSFNLGGTNFDIARTLHIGPAGTIYASGSANTATGLHLIAFAVKPNGGLEPTFDGDGKWSSAAFSSADGASFAATLSGTLFCMAGYRSISNKEEGYVECLDSATGTPQDRVITPLAAEHLQWRGVDSSIAGELVVAGTARNGAPRDVVMATLDIASGNVVSTSRLSSLPQFAGLFTETAAMSSYAVAGSVQTEFGPSDFLVVDTTNGNTTQIAFDVPGSYLNDRASAVASPGVGNHFVVGSVSNPEFGFDVGVAAIKDGELDASFGGYGLVSEPGLLTLTLGVDPASQKQKLSGPFPASSNLVAGVAVDAYGRIYIAGTHTQFNQGSEAVVARLLPDGALDPSFGVGGRAIVGASDGPQTATAIGLQGDDVLLLTQTGTLASGADASVYRLKGSPPAGLFGNGFEE